MSNIAKTSDSEREILFRNTAMKAGINAAVTGKGF